jgi:hypothetical protein
MSQQHPQQPGWGQPQQPQPGWGAPPPQPPKRKVGKTLGIIAAAFVAVLVIGAVASSGDKTNGSSSTDAKPAASAAKDGQPAAAPGEETTDDKPKVVTFKVWGTAPAGPLGPLDITYGSDTDTRQGTFKNGKFEATLPLNDDAMFYNVMAQLQGSGDLNCSVTVGGHTEKAHAAGGYNICHAQANAGLLGGWG